MPSKNMLPKGKRRQSVRPEYVRTRGVVEPEPEPEPPPPVQVVAVRTAKVQPPKPEVTEAGGVRSLVVDPAGVGKRLDAYLATSLPEVSRARVQMLIQAGQVRIGGEVAKAKLKLRGGERIEVEGEPRPAPLRAEAEDLPLEIVYEDEWLLIVNKAAGMTVHAGAGATDDARNRGTLVNALLFHLGASLAGVGDAVRPGIVHRLDRETSGLMVVAKDDETHRRLSAMFAAREVHKQYMALAQGLLREDETTVTLPIARDLERRVRMTTRRADGRRAVSHVHVVERLKTAWGGFSLVEVGIETGRTHQIRVHLQSLTHPVVGDTLYGAARVLRAGERELVPGRNFLHAARLGFQHPRTGTEMVWEAPLPPELAALLERLRTDLAA